MEKFEKFMEGFDPSGGGPQSHQMDNSNMKYLPISRSNHGYAKGQVPTTSPGHSGPINTPSSEEEDDENITLQMSACAAKCIKDILFVLLDDPDKV